jgi:hypothetical protein
MDTRSLRRWAIAGGILILLLVSGAFLLAEDKVREPAVAGAFYPSDPTELRSMVERFLKNVPKKPDIQHLIGLVSPHAGYIYSGHVAAHAYAQLKGRTIERVVVISPSHVKAFRGVAIYDGDAYRTPLGRIPVDKSFAKALAKLDSRLHYSDEGHQPVGGRGEHALEVQLPFLQVVLGDFKLVPIVMGEQSYETCRALGVALAKMIKDERTLIVASSDLSHYHPYDDAVELDRKFLDALVHWDYYSMWKNLAVRRWEACGGGPIISLMIAAERLGANRIELLKYANSGDVPAGTRSQVVGYAAAALYRGESGNPEDENFSLTKEQCRKLMELAKRSVYAAVHGKGPVQPGDIRDSELWTERGAFVTLRKRHYLRGCIGYTSPVKPLCETVVEVARLAALRDPRFPPVSEKEFDDLEFEISVLSHFRHILNPDEIQVGKHGLLVKRGPREGILLPQVPVEQGWDRLTFLKNACLKAGLPPDAWKDEDTDIFVFTAFVFGENDLK